MMDKPCETLEKRCRYFLECRNAKVTNGDTVCILGDTAFRAINEGRMIPYMNYEPRTLGELLETKNEKWRVNNELS